VVRRQPVTRPRGLVAGQIPPLAQGLDRARQDHAPHALLPRGVEHVEQPAHVGPLQHRKIGVVGVRCEVHDAVDPAHGGADAFAIDQIDHDGIGHVGGAHAIEAAHLMASAR
jgi:hypothetical protein